MPDMQSYATQMAAKYSIDPQLFLRLIQQESGWRPDVTSPAGAYGLAQLMPDTARGLGVDPTNWQQNLEGGAKYLRQMLDMFGGDYKLALAAYNAGPGNVQKADNQVPNIPETQDYVRSILGAGQPANARVNVSSAVNYNVRGQAVPKEPTKQPYQDLVSGGVKKNAYGGSDKQPPASTSQFIPAPIPRTGDYSKDSVAISRLLNDSYDKLHQYILAHGVTQKSITTKQYPTGPDGQPDLTAEPITISYKAYFNSDGEEDTQASQLAAAAEYYSQALDQLVSNKKAGIDASGNDAAKAYVQSEITHADEARKEYEQYIKQVSDLQSVEDVPVARQMALAQALNSVNTANKGRQNRTDTLLTMPNAQQSDFGPMAAALKKNIPGAAPAPYQVPGSAYGYQRPPATSTFPPPDPSHPLSQAYPIAAGNPGINPVSLGTAAQDIGVT